MDWNKEFWFPTMNFTHHGVTYTWQIKKYDA